RCASADSARAFAKVAGRHMGRSFLRTAGPGRNSDTGAARGMARVESKEAMKPKQMHLYRGAPCVRSWSKCKATDQRWTLCGIQDHKEPRLNCTADPSLVSCRFCRDLAGLPKLAAVRLKAQSEGVR